MTTPLAELLRPSSIDDVVGQKHLLAKGKALRGIIDSGKIPNLIFYGPSGVGKTTVAKIIAEKSGMRLHKLNATTASTSDIKDIVNEIGTVAGMNGILLYLDEIQYFNKKQQQILLQFIESGDITLIASTTENPYFYVYNAILSRSTVFEFKQIEPSDILPVIYRSAEYMGKQLGKKIIIKEDVAKIIAYGCGGDVRKAVNTVEACLLAYGNSEQKQITVKEDLAREVTGTSAMRYDREGDDHYDIVSAYQKSMRGSDPDAALHYLARLLEAGDLPSACRRLMVCAAEDVGLAYPMILPIVKAAVDIALQVGLPEAKIPLGDAVILVATAPKSNSGHDAIAAALADVQSGKTGPVPRNLQNKHFDGADAMQKGQNYVYPHPYPDHYVKQNYMPELLQGVKYYEYGDNKTEQSFKTYWDAVKKRHGE